jgi:hypothetical protein
MLAPRQPCPHRCGSLQEALSIACDRDTEDLAHFSLERAAIAFGARLELLNQALGQLAHQDLSHRPSKRQRVLAQR